MVAHHLVPSEAEGGESLSEEKALTVGQYLRLEREKRNISLADVAKVTRITLSNLEALERDEFHGFPAPFFVRGFLRTYATHLGLDPGKVLALFEAQTEIPLSAGKMKEPTPSFRLQPLIQYLVILILLVAGVGIAYVYIPKEPSPQPSLSAGPPKSINLKGKTAPPPGLLSAPALPKIPEAEKKVLKLKAMERTWVRFRLDDQPEFDVLLQPGETITRTANRQIKLTVGNAGGVEAYLNGKLLRRFGESGQVVHLLFPDDLRKFESVEGRAP